MQTAKDRHDIVRDIIITHKSLIDIVVVAILLAFGVNLISNYIISEIISPSISGLMGAIICFIALLYLLNSLFSKRIKSQRYEAFLIYNEKKNKIIQVPRYIFSERISDYLNSAFVEEPALKALWEKYPLKDLFVDNPTENMIKRYQSVKLISEATEYFVLSELSMHLMEYFAAKNFKEEKLKKYLRNDVPEVLLKNRFLELFSRPMENRPVFHTDTFEEAWGISVEIEKEGETIVMYTPEGPLYEKFELVLPKDSIVQRLEDNSIKIETKKLTITLKVRFEGFSTVLPRGFKKYYLGIKELEDVNVYEVNIDIKISVKLGALFTRIGWEYYYWIDSFLEQVDNVVSKDVFFKNIGWNTALTVLQCLNSEQAKHRDVHR